MYKHRETENRAEKKITLFFVSNKSPNYGAFILFNHFKLIICYQ